MSDSSTQGRPQDEKDFVSTIDIRGQIASIIISAYFALRQLNQLRKNQNYNTISNLIELYNRFRKVRINIFRNEQVDESDKSRLCNFLDEVGYVTYQLPTKDRNIAIGLWAETYIRCWIKLRDFVSDKRPQSIIRDYAYFEWLASKGYEFHRDNFRNNPIKFFEYNKYRDTFESLESYKHNKDGDGLCLTEPPDKKEKIIFRDSNRIVEEFIRTREKKMNTRKGLLRLTLVLSIIMGIVIPASLLENHKYRRYEVKRELKNVAETVNFEWYEKSLPTFDDLWVIFQGVSKETSGNKIQKFRNCFHEYDDLDDYELLNRLAKKYSTWKDVLIRWERKGENESRQMSIMRQFVPIKPIPIKPEEIIWDDEATYSILKIENGIKWNTLLFMGGIGFVSVWAIYAFISWVIISFIVRGFKAKS